jgi:acyl-CoA reductase-like NAD-dependent aldehyde dehydrogenase
VLLGGAAPNTPGAYYPPTVLTDVHKGMPAYEEELFGPVASIIPTTDEEQAIAIGNDTAFGLGGGVITRDLARGEQIAAERIESGTVFVNNSVRSDPRLPFGGVIGKRIRARAVVLWRQGIRQYQVGRGDVGGSRLAAMGEPRRRQGDEDVIQTPLQPGYRLTR